MSIQLIMKQVESFTVTGFSVRTQNSDEFNEKTAKLPSLWQQFYSSELATNTRVFGVYSNYASDAHGLYTVTVGVEASPAAPQLSSVSIHSGSYLVFQGTGPMPTTVVEVWKQVWAFFEGNKEHRRNFISDFEVYDGSDRVMIYIGLESFKIED